MDPYDAVLVVSFGGPEGPEEVIPFLERVTAGRGIPAERLAAVGEHYFARGGVSPINDECRRFLSALRRELEAQQTVVPVWWGNRNSAPFLGDTVTEMVAAGHRRALAWVTSAYPGYSGCRQYRENLAAALVETPELQIDIMGPHAEMPEFSNDMGEGLASAVRELHAEGLATHEIRALYVSHSIPLAMDDASGPPDMPRAYTATHRAVALRVEQACLALGVEVEGELAWCSRSGPPTQPWLEPDVCDAMANLAPQGVRGVVVVPIGFVADHMEVVHDLDTEAAAKAAELGLAFRRVSTVRDHPQYITGVVRMLKERAYAVATGQVRRCRDCGRDSRMDVPVVGCRLDCCLPTRGAPRPVIGEGTW